MSVDLEEYYDRIYRYCYMQLRHRQAAEDATQETFLRFLQNHSYREMGKKSAYLYTIARNLCMDYYRKNAKISFVDEIVEEGKQEVMLDYFALRQALHKLDSVEQELIFLRYVNDLPVKEIGKIMNLSRFAVRRKVNSSLKKLKAFMEEN